MAGVTRQQEKFLQELMQGKTQRQAYITAFQTKSWKPQSIDANASALLKKPEVAKRYAELQHDAQEANAITRDAVLAHLKTCAFAPFGTKFRTSDQLKAMELICKITGLTSRYDEDY